MTEVKRSKRGSYVRKARYMRGEEVWKSRKLPRAERVLKYHPYLRGFGKGCTTCSNIRPIEEFCKDQSSPDGHHRSCKRCRSIKRYFYYRDSGYLARERERYKLRKEEKLAAQRARYRATIERQKARGLRYRQAHLAEIAAKRKLRYQTAFYRLSAMTRQFNRFKGTNFHRDDVRKYWLHNTTFRKAMKRWRDNGFDKITAPVFDWKKKGEPVINKLKIITVSERRREYYYKHCNFHLHPNSIAQRFRSKPRDPITKRFVSKVQESQANKQLEA